MTSFLSDYGIAFLIVGASGLAFAFYRGLESGRRAAWHRFSNELSILRESQGDVIQRVNESNKKVQVAVQNAQIIPKGSVMVSYLEEGESLHLLPDGYIMRIEVKYEHRSVAERVLRRSLKTNEVVHHIYAPAKDNNLPSNLCVLDREKHDIFHTYIEREFRLKVRYPRVADQKLTLKNNFDGILLEDVAALLKTEQA